MQANIHPHYQVVTVTCSCKHTFMIHSTLKTDQLKVEICSNCHPFYTGTQKLIDTGGRVARFNKQFEKKVASSNAKDQKEQSV